MVSRAAVSRSGSRLRCRGVRSASADGLFHRRISNDASESGSDEIDENEIADNCYFHFDAPDVIIIVPSAYCVLERTVLVAGPAEEEDFVFYCSGT